MPNYNDPSGYGSWWVNPGETPEQAKARIDAQNPADTPTLSQNLSNTIASPGGNVSGVPGNTSLSAAGGNPVGDQRPQAGPGSGNLTVRMPDGSTQQFSGEYWKDPKLDAALKANGIPLDPIDGTPMKVDSGVYGGYLFNGLPINVIGTGEFLPDQEQALNNYYAAGYKPGGGALSQPPALPQSAEAYGGNGPFDFGYLAQPFNEKFKAPEGQPGAFKFDPSNITNDPGYQFTLDEGMKAVQRAQSAGMRLSSGRGFKEASRYAEDYAGTKVNDAYNRDLTTHQAATTDYNNEWDRTMQEYMQRYNVDTGNKTNIFNRFSSLAGMGQVSAGQLSAAGTRFGETAGQNIVDSTTYSNAAALAAARARATAANNTANSLYSVPGARTTSLADARA